jgi:hypothetical protein
MHIDTKLTLAGAGSILLFDTIASILSAHVHYPIAWCCLANLAVYCGVTYWAAKHLNLPGALTFGAFLGLVDATAGWKLSDWLGADPDHHLQKITFNTWCLTVVLAMILTTFIALVAYSKTNK